MITREEVLRLAALARINIPESEIERLRTDIDTILAYVDSVKEAGAKLSPNENSPDGANEISDLHIVRSVLREDSNPHESGIYTESLLHAAPEREGNFIKVKKILAN